MKIFRNVGTFFISFIFLSQVNGQTQNKQDLEIIYIGTYTKKEGHVDGKAEGIYTIYRDPETGNLKKGETVARPVNPSFLKISEDNSFLFAVSEVGPGDAESGSLFSYRINEDGSLTELTKISTEGFAPAHIEIDQSGKYIFVSNYVGGVVLVYKISRDGMLQKQQRIDLENPQQSHAHSVTLSPNNKHAYVADLGNDRIWIFNFSAEKGELQPAREASVGLPKGAGPRHFEISGDGRFAYSVNELNNTITAFNVDDYGGLDIIQHISTLPQNFSGKIAAAEIHLHPQGRFLYISNRGDHNSITSFGIDQATAKLSKLQDISSGGKIPRSFIISPDGDFLYVANQDSDNIVGFKINRETGELTPAGELQGAMTPVSLQFIRD